MYGKAEQNGEPTPDNPIEIVVSGSDGSVEVVSCGKNLYNELTLNKEYSYGGVTLTKDAETGNLTISGTATASNNMIMNPLTLPAGTYYYQKGNVTNCGVALYNQTAKTFISTNKELSFTLTEESVLDVRVQTVTGQSPSGTIKIQIEKGSAMTEYEPYTETTSTIPTPNGLAGIKVSSGGNYTDENGQQWVCDEIVKYADGSGKRIQRIGTKVLDGNESWENGQLLNSDNFYRYFIKTENFNIKKTQTPVLCNYFMYYESDGWYADKEGIYLYSDDLINIDIASKIQTQDEWRAWLAENKPSLSFILAEPIITDLTAEEIAEIEKLHTFYPITNIYNDAECGMEITYISTLLEFIEPKTDWTEQDAFDYVAYNRVSGNIMFLKELADDLFGNLTELSLETEKENLSLIYARHMNAIEDGLDRLNIETYKKNIGDKKTYYPNKNVPDADEYNRIENACLMLYEALQAHKINLPRLAFRLGNQKGIRV